jgi:hypothetical protein
LLSNLFTGIYRNSAAQSPAEQRAAARAQSISQLLPRHMQPLEVWLLLFCGLYGLLVGAAMGRGVFLQFMCMGYIGLALVRHLQPAQTRRQWLLGAAAAVGLTATIFISPESGGGSGPYLYLLILLATGYPLVMGGRSALVFTLSLLTVYFASAWFHPLSVPLPLFGVRAFLIAGMCVMSARLGHSLRQSQWLFEILLHDRESLAHNNHGLRFYGERLLRRCQADRQPCSVALLRMPAEWLPACAVASADLVSVRGTLSPNEDHNDARASALQDMARHLARALPPKSVVARTGQGGDWVLVAPQIARKQLVRDLMVAFGHPLQLPFGKPADEMFVAVTPCVVEAGPGMDTLDALIEQAYSLWSRSERVGTVSLT